MDFGDGSGLRLVGRLLGSLNRIDGRNVGDGLLDLLLNGLFGRHIFEAVCLVVYEVYGIKNTSNFTNGRMRVR